MKNIVDSLEKRIYKIERILEKMLKNHLHHIQMYQWYLMGLSVTILAFLTMILFKI